MTFFQINSEDNLKSLEKITSGKRIFETFLGIVEVPRPSGSIETIRDLLIQWAEKHEFESQLDSIGNVIIRVPATKGCEAAPIVCLQGHMDIVATSDEPFDFKTQTITTELIDDGKWLTAKGTTLGADNGIGIALALTIATDEKVSHGPLELLFTVDEETTMVGAFGLEQNILRSSYLLNIDSEDDGMICVGSAGGSDKTLTIPIEKVDAPEAAQMKVRISGFMGGHSGVDIHLGRASANVWMSRCLSAAMDVAPSMTIASITGGHVKNAIAGTAEAIISVKEEELEVAERAIQEVHAAMQREYRVIETKGIEIVLSRLEEESRASKVMIRESAAKVLGFVLSIPHGVIRIHPEIPGLVEASQNLAIVQTTEDSVIVSLFIRSSSESQLVLAENRLKAICRLAGAEYAEDKSKDFPIWEPNTVSNPVLDHAVSAYKKVFRGKEPIVYSIHAGLENAVIQLRYPNLEGSVSIGPTIREPHSTQERLEIETVQKNYDFLAKLLENIGKEKRN